MDKVLFIFIIFAVANLALCQNTSESNPSTSSELDEARTFGHHLFKRLSFAIIPTAFVVGVIMTLLAALTVVSIKGLGVGVVLLVIALGQILGRSFQSPPPAPLYNPAPVPYISYPRPAETVPVWLEKDW